MGSHPLRETADLSEQTEPLQLAEQRQDMRQCRMIFHRLFAKPPWRKAGLVKQTRANIRAQSHVSRFVSAPTGPNNVCTSVTIGANTTFGAAFWGWNSPKGDI
jgi:hypothetical protein